MVSRIKVRSYELDSFGHVNNAVYLQYLEAARGEYLQQMGLSFADIAGAGFQIVIVDAQIRFLLPARESETLRIEAQIESLKAASLVFTYRIVREDDGALIATASTTGASFDPTTGRPVRWPARFREAFAAVAQP